MMDTLDWLQAATMLIVAGEFPVELANLSEFKLIWYNYRPSLV